jgi:hypothetical protein
MPQATTDGNTEDIRFVLDVKDDSPINCVADYGTASQIASGLGNAIRFLRAALSAKGAVVPLSVEHLSTFHVERNLLEEEVVMTVTTASGIPYLFQLPTQVALELSDQLRTEALKANPMGNA